jgi:hypothetical protein
LVTSNVGGASGGGIADGGDAAQERVESILQHAETPSHSMGASADPQAALGDLLVQVTATFIGEQHVPPTM